MRHLPRPILAITYLAASLLPKSEAYGSECVFVECLSHFCELDEPYAGDGNGLVAVCLSPDADASEEARAPGSFTLESILFGDVDEASLLEDQELRENLSGWSQPQDELGMPAPMPPRDICTFVHVRDDRAFAYAGSPFSPNDVDFGAEGIARQISAGCDQVDDLSQLERAEYVDSLEDVDACNAFAEEESEGACAGFLLCSGSEDAGYSWLVALLIGFGGWHLQRRSWASTQTLSPLS